MVERPYYSRALAALEAAHKACFEHPGRDVLGMSSGPFSGVNEALGIVAELEARAKTAEAELARLRAAGTFNEGIEAAGAKIENMIFLLPISRAEEGSIASRDEMLDEMVEQASSAIRSLLRPDDGGK